MRRLLITALAATAVFALPLGMSAKQFPAVSHAACAKVGGEFTMDKSTKPPTMRCVAPIGTAGSETIDKGDGFIVQVSWTAGTAFYTFTAGERVATAIGGAIGVTACWTKTPEPGVLMPVELPHANCTP
jgi:hypothetical protein